MSELTILEIEFGSQAGKTVIYPVIIHDDKDMVLLDCGYPGALPLLKAAAEKKGLDLARLTQIIITHHDFDHIGTLGALKRAYSHLEVISSVEESEYISGKRQSLRLQQAEKLYPTLPESQKATAREFHDRLAAVETVYVDRIVGDKEVLPYCGGIEIIATPGHMPGHISLYHQESKTLITGDAMVVTDGKLGIANPQYTLDMPGALSSMKKFLLYDINAIVCYHGGLVTKEVRSSLEKLVSIN